MEIREVTVSFGCTINLGNYENMRSDVQVRAEITQGEIDKGGLNELATTARKELAYSLHDMAEAQLKRISRWSEVEAGEYSEYNERRAADGSDEFRWILKLHPDMAKDLLAEVVGDWMEAQKAELSAEADDGKYPPLNQDEVDELLASETEDFDDDDEDDYDPQYNPEDDDFSDEGDDIREPKPSDDEPAVEAPKGDIPF